MSLRARLTIDLDAIVANWRALDALSGPGCETAAVVKADGYGLGAAEVGTALARAGVRTFFVAVAAEGEALRAAIGPDPAIYILGGYARETLSRYMAQDLRPVLNSAEQARAWFSDRPGAAAAVQVDTGMNRLGMEPDELAALGPLPDAVTMVMSHMGCADEPGHPLNGAQLAEFRRLTEGPGRSALALRDRRDAAGPRLAIRPRPPGHRPLWRLAVSGRPPGRHAGGADHPGPRPRPGRERRLRRRPGPPAAPAASPPSGLAMPTA